jgi:hypothetical protein
MKKIILLCLLLIGLLLVGCATQEGYLETPPIAEEELTEDQQADLVIAGSSQESGALAGQAVFSSYFGCQDLGDSVKYNASWKSGIVSPKVSCSAAKSKAYIRSCTDDGYLNMEYVFNCDCSDVQACLSGTAPTVTSCSEGVKVGGVGALHLMYSDGSGEEKVNFCSGTTAQKYVCDDSAPLKYKVEETLCNLNEMTCSAGACKEPSPATVSLISANKIEVNAGDFHLWKGYMLVDGQKVSNICPTTWCDRNTAFTVDLPSELSAGTHEIEIWTSYQGWGFTAFDVEVLGAPACNNDADCGGSVTENYCNDDGEACSKTTLNVCSNPGTPQAVCTTPAGGGSCSACLNGCTDGACVASQQKFCYYVDSEGVQKPAGWSYTNFSWSEEYSGVVTEDGESNNTCNSENTKTHRQRCGVAPSYFSGPDVSINSATLGYCNSGKCDPTNNQCCKILEEKLSCQGSNVTNTTTTCDVITTIKECQSGTTCFEPPMGAVNWWITSCFTCGTPICESDTGVKYYGYKNAQGVGSCSGNYQIVGYITGPDCPPTSSGGSGGGNSSG